MKIIIENNDTIKDTGYTSVTVTDDDNNKDYDFMLCMVY